MTWRQTMFDVQYRLGRPIWDTPPPDQLRDAIEGPDRLPAGHALDVGCGTGTNVTYLAQFLSQIVDYQDVDLARRAILATLLARNLHADGDDYDDSYLEGVQLSGVKLVPSAISEDYSLSEGSSDGIKLPTFDGDHKGDGGKTQRGPLDEAIHNVT